MARLRQPRQPLVARVPRPRGPPSPPPGRLLPVAATPNSPRITCRHLLCARKPVQLLASPSQPLSLTKSYCSVLIASLGPSHSSSGAQRLSEHLRLRGGANLPLPSTTIAKGGIVSRGWLGSVRLRQVGTGEQGGACGGYVTFHAGSPGRSRTAGTASLWAPRVEVVASTSSSYGGGRRNSPAARGYRWR